MNQPNPAEPSLIEVAQQLYKDHGSLLSTRDISKRMDVSHEWVRKFIAGQIPNPGVLTLEKFIAAIKDAKNV
jgi:hypothetical protein